MLDFFYSFQLLKFTTVFQKCAGNLQVNMLSREVIPYLEICCSKISASVHEFPTLVNSADNKTVNGTDGLEFNDVWLSLEFGDCGNSLEQILSKIEVAQSQVRKLKDRIDKVLTENPGKYTSINRLSLLMPCNGSTSSDQNMASPSENGDGMPDRSQCISPPHISEGNMGDLFMPENAVSSHGDVIPLPDILESTDHYQVGDLCETVSCHLLTMHYPW